VMSGMGRTGTLHAWEQEGVTPDIQIVAKGLGAGYQPIGGILVHGRVIEGLSRGSGAFMHGHTYQAHPVACAAAVAVQQVIAEEGLLGNVQAMGTRLEQRLVERFGNHRHIGHIRGRGLFWAVEFVRDRATKQVFDSALKLHERVKREAIDRGLACYPMGGTIDGRQGDHAILASPYIATAAQIDLIVDRFGAAVDAALASCG
jgi:adenosylmethionine-8-amino-7-oxononanoate aminotransferase